MSDKQIHWSPTLVAVSPTMLVECPMTIVAVATHQSGDMGLTMSIRLKMNGTDAEGPFFFLPECDYDDGHCLEELAPTQLNEAAREFIQDLGAREPDDLILPAHNQVIGLFFLSMLVGLKRA